MDTENIFITDLPHELLEIVMLKLDAASQQRIRRVCSSWNEIIADSYGDCRRHVCFELDSGGGMKPSKRSGKPYQKLRDSLEEIFSICVGEETKEITFFQQRPVADSWPYGGYFSLMEALRSRIHHMYRTDKGRPFVLRRLVFAKLTIPPEALSRTVFCRPEVVREVWLCNVTLLALLDLLTVSFSMEIPEINKHYNTAKDVDPFEPFDGSGYAWAKYVARCGGPLNQKEEKVVLKSLRDANMMRKLGEEMKYGDVADTFNDRFREEVETMEVKDITPEWLRRFDVWTLRFIFHYCLSIMQ